MPKFEVGGEYWNTGGRKQAAELTTTLAANILTGNLGTIGKAVQVVSSATQAGEAATGKDLASGEILSTSDRVARGVTGGVGIYAGRGFAKKVGEAGLDGVRRAGAAIKQEVETTLDAVRHTPTGLRPAMAGASDDASAIVNQGDDAARALNIEARAARDVESAARRQNINTHEAAGGHTIERHVKKSDVELKERLGKELALDDASTFYSEAIANRVQMEYVTKHKQEIADWLKTGDYNLVGKIEMSEPVGKVVGRGKSSAAVETNKATVVLIRNDSPQGYYIRTSYPSR